MPFLTGTMYMIALAGPFYIMYTGTTLTRNWVSSAIMLHGVFGSGVRARARENTQKSHPTVTGITDTNFLSNATGNGDRKCI